LKIIEALKLSFGIEIYDLHRKRDIGNGFFVNVPLAWQL